MMKIKLKKIAKVLSGSTAPKDNEFSENNGKPFIRAGHLEELCNGKSLMELPKIEESVAQNRKMVLVPENTILFAKSGMSILKNRVYKTTHEAYIVNHLAAIICSNEIEPDYLYYFFRANPPSRLVLDSSYPSIRLSDIGEIDIDLPSKAIQKKISKLLKQAEEIIFKRKAQIEALDQLTQSVFLEMFGDPRLNKKNWKKQKLNDVCLRKGEYGSGSSAIPYDSGKPRYIRITDIRDDGSLNDDIVAPSNPDDYEKYRLNEGDILFARSGATVGKTYLHSEKNGYCIFAGYLIRFVPDTSKINPKFLFHFTRTQYYKQWVMNKQNTVAQPNINAKQYGEELFIICPPLELQNRFAKIVEEIEAEKELLQKSMVELQNNFNSLMQRAFKGELFND